MGLIVKRNKLKQYQLSSSVSDESYHPEKKWLSQDEAKKLLIEMAFMDFIEKAVEIDMEFPNGYTVNDRRCRDEGIRFGEWWLESKCSYEILADKFTEVAKKHCLDIHL